MDVLQPLVYRQKEAGYIRAFALLISIVYYMQKGGERDQIACKTAYVLNTRPLYHNASSATLPFICMTLYSFQC